MNFKFNSIAKRVLWTGPESVLILFKDNDSKKNLEWAVFCHEAPETEKIYSVEGYVGKSSSKKYFDQKGHAGIDYSFNATSLNPGTGQVQEDKFDEEFGF